MDGALVKSLLQRVVTGVLVGSYPFHPYIDFDFDFDFVIIMYAGVGAGLVIAQWRGGQPVAVYPPSAATHTVVWVGA